MPLHVNFDNATKLLTFADPHRWVGAVTYGDAVIGARTAHSFIPEFELELGKKRLPVFKYAERLSEFFLKHWKESGMAETGGNSQGMSFVVSGYDEGEPYGTVFLFNVPNAINPEPRNPDDFGMTWGGQLAIASRIIHGHDPALLPFLREQLRESGSQIDDLEGMLKARFEYTIPYNMLPLQDCVDLAIFLVRTTITAQNLAVGVRGVGGTIEVATISRTDGLQWVQKKELHGEVPYDHPHSNH